MAGAGTVVTSGDIKGFRWDLVAFRDGNRTRYRVDHRESVAGRDCADFEAREIAAASIIYVDTVLFAVGIAGQEVEQVSIKYSIAYSIGRDGEIQYEPGETRQTTVGWDRSDARLFIAAMPKASGSRRSLRRSEESRIQASAFHSRCVGPGRDWFADIAQPLRRQNAKGIEAVIHRLGGDRAGEPGGPPPRPNRGSGGGAWPVKSA